MAEDKKKSFGVLEGVLAYAKIAEPDFAYQSKDTEYSIQVIVDEDAADAWEEQFKKQPARKIKVADFETKYRFPCPIAGAKNVYAITLKRTAVKDGEPFFPETRPKVFLDTSDGRLDITESRLIANGSFGKVSYRINSNDFGTFAKLQNVLMDEEGFKEYVSTGGKAGSEFGGDDKPITKEAARDSAVAARKAKIERDLNEPEPPEEKKAAAKPAKPQKPSKPVVDDDDDSAPF